jgi:formamidopyrimidine-DNA glycosylase
MSRETKEDSAAFLLSPMPELPEVETMVRDLAHRVCDRTIIHVETSWDRMVVHPTPEEFRQRLVGQRIIGLNRRGKYAIFELETGELLVVHRGMSGSLLLRRSNSPDDRHVRARFVLDNGYELRFDDARKFGRLYLIRPEAEGYALPWARMGPEPLDDQLTATAFRARFAGRSAPIKTLLLNQHVLAGIGNIYADEALFVAGIHPARRANTLTEGELDRLQQAIRHVLAGSIALRGTTFSTYRDLEGRHGAYQHYLRVFRRDRSGCPRCGAEIRKMILGGRSTYFCPHCQK